jgi:hypothetical protein
MNIRHDAETETVLFMRFFLIAIEHMLICVFRWNLPNITYDDAINLKNIVTVRRGTHRS